MEVFSKTSSMSLNKSLTMSELHPYNSNWDALDSEFASRGINIKWYGARGDGLTNDTQAIQRAIDKNPSRYILIPPGTYVVTSLKIPVGITIIGYGAVLYRPNMAGAVRTLTTEGYTWDSPMDSAPITIKGLTIDGNLSNQGAYRNYEQEQSGLLFISGSSSNAGKVVAIVEDCTFKNSVGDGLFINNNAIVKVVNCQAYECFRGGITITGGWTDVDIVNFTGTGDVNKGYIHIEVSEFGYNNSYKTNISINGATLDQKLDVTHYANSDSRFVGNNIILAPGAVFYISNIGSTAKFSNCVLNTEGNGQPGHIGITYPGDLTFDNCTFVGSRVNPTSPATIHAAYIEMNTSSTSYSGQVCRFLSCHFKVDPSVVSGTDIVYAIYYDADDNMNRVIIQDCIIRSGFDYGVYVYMGGNPVIKDTMVDAVTALTLNWDTGYHIDAVVDGVEIRNSNTTIAEYINTYGSGGKYTHKNMIIDESLNTLGTHYGVQGNAYYGGRIIMVTNDPTIAGHGQPGLMGDRCVLKTPVIGQHYMWVCTSGHVNGSSAQWTPMIAL